MKDHKGSLTNWWVFYPDRAEKFAPKESLGYIIRGTFVDHEDFAGEDGHTSWVVSHDETSGYIETMNSRYTLLGAPKRPPQRYGER